MMAEWCILFWVFLTLTLTSDTMVSICNVIMTQIYDLNIHKTYNQLAEEGNVFNILMNGYSQTIQDLFSFLRAQRQI